MIATLAVLLCPSVWALTLAGPSVRSSLRAQQPRMGAAADGLFDRRSVVSLAPAAALYASLPGRAANAADGAKIVVVGGAGYVGAYVDQLLLKEGCTVVSVSRSTAAEQAEKVKKILGSSLAGVEFLSLDASTADLSGAFKGASAVISCVGVAPGGANQRAGNGRRFQPPTRSGRCDRIGSRVCAPLRTGAVNVRIADAAKAAGVDKFVYLGVASELANGPAKFLLGDYLKGKAEAEAAVFKDYGESALVIKPGIIAGAPPGEIRPPGPPGMTAVSAEAVARAAVAGALGKKTGKIDGNDAIIAATK